MEKKADMQAEIAAAGSPSATTENPPVSPELFMDAAWAFHKTAAIKAAVELDVFTKIGAGAAISLCSAPKRAPRRAGFVFCATT